MWSDLVSVGALGFTVASFWWIYLRRGHLRTPAPDTYAAGVRASVLRIRFPLVFVNTGAATLSVESLRMVVEGHALEWVSVHRSIRPLKDDFVDLAAPFIVRGRDATRLFVEFGGDGSRWSPEPRRRYRVQIEQKIGDRWKPLVEFDWHSPRDRLSSYIAHRNRPEGGAPPAVVDPSE